MTNSIDSSLSLNTVNEIKIDENEIEEYTNSQKMIIQNLDSRNNSEQEIYTRNENFNFLPND